jgi:hypothetical protein
VPARAAANVKHPASGARAGPVVDPAEPVGRAEISRRIKHIDETVVSLGDLKRNAGPPLRFPAPPQHVTEGITILRAREAYTEYGIHVASLT